MRRIEVIVGGSLALLLSVIYVAAWMPFILQAVAARCFTYHRGDEMNFSDLVPIASVILGLLIANVLLFYITSIVWYALRPRTPEQREMEMMAVYLRSHLNSLPLPVGILETQGGQKMMMLLIKPNKKQQSKIDKDDLSVFIGRPVALELTTGGNYLLTVFNWADKQAAA